MTYSVKLGNYDAIDLMAARPMAYVDVDGLTVIPASVAHPLPVVVSTGAGVPIEIGGVANASAPTAVGPGARIEAWFNPVGALNISFGASGGGPDGYSGIIRALGRDGSTYGVLGVGLTGYNPLDGLQYSARCNAQGLFAVAKPDTVGGLTASRIVTGTSGVVKAAAGQAYKITAYNANAGVRYLHLYNKATAPTLSTDTPLLTLTLLGASVREIDLTTIGAAFATGIAWAYTTDDVAIPTTAGTSAELHATIFYN